MEIIARRTTHRKEPSIGTSGIPFTRGPLAHLLRNRFYIGEVTLNGEILKGNNRPFWTGTCSAQCKPSSANKQQITKPQG